MVFISLCALVYAGGSMVNSKCVELIN